MLENNYIAAIDIGGSKVVVAIGEVLPQGDVRPVAAYSEPMDGEAVKNGEVRNVINLQQKIRKCLDNIREEEGFLVKKAVINLSGAHIMCVDFDYSTNIRNRGKQVSQQDLDELYQEAVNKHAYDNYFIVDIIPQAYYVDDVHVTSPLGTIGRKIKGEFCVVVCDKTSKDIFDEVFKSLEVEPISYVVSSLASADSALLDDEKEYGVALIDMGSDCCDIVVYKDNIPCDVGVVPLGGRNINEDIASLKVLPRYIENIKINYARAIAEKADFNKVISLPIKSDNINKRVIVRELCGVVEARAREIAEEVFGFLQEGGKISGLGAGIVLTGGCAKLQDIDDIFKEVTGYDNVVVRFPNISLQEKNELLSDPEYSTVVGLLMSGKNIVKDVRYQNGVEIIVEAPIIDETQESEVVVEDSKYVLEEEKENNIEENSSLDKEESSEEIHKSESEEEQGLSGDEDSDLPEDEEYDDDEEDEYDDDEDYEDNSFKEKKHKGGLGEWFSKTLKGFSEPKDNVNDFDS